MVESLDVGTRIYRVMDIIRGGTELIYQRIGQTDAANSSVNSRLVTSIQFSLDAGYGVVVIGHSQGTIFVQNALKQVDAWWTEEVRKGDACGPPPVAAIYVAPAIPVAGRGNERYVLLNGDRIRMIGLKDPTVNPTPAQELKSLHSLSTYLMPGTPSQLQILEHYDTLKREVLERAEFGLSKVQVIVNEQKKELEGYEGGTVKYGVRLACKPDLEVAIWLESAGDVSFAEHRLLFDPRIPSIDWDKEQTVSVTINEGAYAPDEDDIVPVSLIGIGHTSESNDPTFENVDIAEVVIEVLPKERTPTPEPQPTGATPLKLGQYNAALMGVPAWDNSATLLVSPCYTTVDGKAANIVEINFSAYDPVIEKGVDDDGNETDVTVEKYLGIGFRGFYFRDTGEVTGVVEGSRADVWNDELREAEETTPLDGTFTGRWDGTKLSGSWQGTMDGRDLKGTWNTTEPFEELPCEPRWRR